jgi:hypothetical protein
MRLSLEGEVSPVDFNPCDNLKYGFQYNVNEKAIELCFSFLHEFPEDSGAVVIMEPYARVFGYHRGKKSHEIFDNPQTAKQVAREAEALFGRELGRAIDVALQRLSHKVAKKLGILTLEDKDFANALALSDRRELAKELEVKRGPKKGPRGPQQRHKRYSDSVFPSKLNEAIRAVDKARGLGIPTRKEVAAYMEIGGARTLDRRIKRMEEKTGQRMQWRARVEKARNEEKVHV